MEQITQAPAFLPHQSKPLDANTTREVLRAIGYLSKAQESLREAEDEAADAQIEAALKILNDLCLNF